MRVLSTIMSRACRSGMRVITKTSLLERFLNVLLKRAQTFMRAITNESLYMRVFSTIMTCTRKTAMRH